MTGLFRLTLNITEQGAVEIRTEHPAISGERSHTVPLPFDNITLPVLLKILEPQPSGTWQLSDDETAFLQSIEVVQNNRLVSLNERNRRIGEQLYQCLFPTNTDVDRDIRGALTMALAQQEEALPLQLRVNRNAVKL